MSDDPSRRDPFQDIGKRSTKTARTPPPPPLPPRQTPRPLLESAAAAAAAATSSFPTSAQTEEEQQLEAQSAAAALVTPKKDRREGSLEPPRRRPHSALSGAGEALVDLSASPDLRVRTGSLTTGLVYSPPPPRNPRSSPPPPPPSPPPLSPPPGRRRVRITTPASSRPSSPPGGPAAAAAAVVMDPAAINAFTAAIRDAIDSARGGTGGGDSEKLVVASKFGAEEGEDFIEWMSGAQIALAGKSWTDTQKNRYLMGCMKKSAAVAVRQLDPGTHTTPQFFQALERLFLTEGGTSSARQHFRDAVQQKGESLLAWHMRVQNLYRRANPNVGTDPIDGVLDVIERFALGLRNQHLGKLVARESPRTLTEAMNLATRFVAVEESFGGGKGGAAGAKISAVGGGGRRGGRRSRSSSHSDDEERVSALKREETRECYECGEVGHLRRNCPSLKKKKGGGGGKGKWGKKKRGGERGDNRSGGQRKEGGRGGNSRGGRRDRPAFGPREAQRMLAEIARVAVEDEEEQEEDEAAARSSSSARKAGAASSPGNG